MGTQESLPAPLVFEVQELRHFPGEWVVEAIDRASEGECYAALFSGQQARERAENYAAWMRNQQWPPVSPIHLGSATSA